jgi:hypothetical protein
VRVDERIVVSAVRLAVRSGTPLPGRASGPVTAIAAVCLVALAACNHGGGGAPKSGSLEVVIESDMTIPRDLDHVTVLAAQDGRALLQVDQDLGPGALLIPAAFDIKATASSSAVTIKAVAYKAGQARVERDAVTPIPAGRDGELRLALNYLCVGTAVTQADGSVVSTCPAGLTCVQGGCQTSTVPQTAVPTYDPGSAPGASGAGGTIGVKDAGAGGCFDVQACFAAAVAVALDQASCTVALPAGTDSASVNVALQFPVGGSGVCGTSACWVVFDEGTDWTVAGGTLQLPAGVCSSAGATGATVVVTTSCLSKTDVQPDCGAWSSVMTPAPQPVSSSPVGQSCAGAASQSCGLCGAQTRTCTNGAWSGWGTCTGEGACMPGATQVCDANGIQTCGVDCQWGACGCASGQTSCGGTCTAFESDVRNCGGCGNDCTQLPHVAGGSAACVSGRCTYGCAAGYQDCAGNGQGCTTSLTTATNCGACGGACGVGDPMCAPASSAAGAGGAGGAGAAGVTGFHCVSGCPAAAPTLCSGSCADLSTSNANCGTCGHACTGSASCKGGTCVCTTGTQACGGTCATTSSDNANCGKCGQVCPSGSTCTSAVCACSGPATQSCGECGSQSRTCTNGIWSAWSACRGEGVCAAGTTTGCTNGTETCDRTCNWSSCQCQTGFTSCAGQCVNEQTDPSNCGMCGHACPQGSTCQKGQCQCPSGSTTQACGNCGTQTRTCNGGTWSGWSACSGEGTCAAGAMQACDTNGTETCDNTCQWSSCVCKTSYTLCNGICVNEQNDSTNCGACAKVCQSGLICQSGKCACPSGTQLCRGACVPLCPSMTSSCFDPNSGLTWAATSAGQVDYATAVATCASFGGSWRLPTYPELEEWPWVSANDAPGELATTPTSGASTCYVSVPSTPSYAAATPNYIWSSTPWSGGSTILCSGVWYELASIVGHKSLSGPPDGFGCSTDLGPQVLCVE